MSARQLDSVSSFQQQVTFQARQTRLNLSTESVVVHKSGIEFRSPTPFSLWTEMTVELYSPRNNGRIQCAGVVIACSGNKHAGYHVSMVFTDLTKQGKAQLQAMAGSELGL
jgi:hypothetical protein